MTLKDDIIAAAKELHSGAYDQWVESLTVEVPENEAKDAGLADGEPIEFYPGCYITVKIVSDDNTHPFYIPPPEKLP